MPKRPSKQVREQVVVYLDARDRALLEDLTKTTGLPKTELFRRGLRRLAGDASSGRAPGYSMRQLIAAADDDDFPPDFSERAAEYMYGRKAPQRKPRKRARPG